MPVLQPPLNRSLVKSRNLLERSTAHRGGYRPEGFEEGTIAGGRRRKSLVRSVLRIFAGAHVRCGSNSEVGCRNREVRFTPESRLNSDIAPCPKSAKGCPQPS